VIGILDSERLDELRDLDDEPLTPVDTSAEGGRLGLQIDLEIASKQPVESFRHFPSSGIVFVPFDDAIDLGGTLRSIALAKFHRAGRPMKDFTARIEPFMRRVALNIFVGRGERVQVYSSLRSKSVAGVPSLVLPMLIVGLIVLNTMMGAVYERLREIGIYSAIGLAPTHVGALFMAEAAVFAIVGAVAGYLLGQGVAFLRHSVGVLSQITLNYSSLSAIYSTLLVMATVILSTIYPAKKAAAMAVPDVTRRWKFPEPVGDLWQFDFPFTVSSAETLGLFTYLLRVFESYGETSIGAFYSEGVALTGAPTGGVPEYVLDTKCWLKPYDLGISQTCQFRAYPADRHGIYGIAVRIVRVSGDVASWRRMNRGFLNVLRKQFLIWRTISPGERDEYRAEGAKLLGETNP
jgi:hypothetical protein